jgi:hypothetical protein
MRETWRTPVVYLFVVGALILVPGLKAQQKAPIAEQVAKAYGLDSWGQIDAVRYTFNVNIGPTIKLSRSWIWEPKSGKVSFDGMTKDGKPLKVTYLRSDLANQPAVVKEEVDPGFMNDMYWLTFPLHLAWDGSVTVEDRGMHKLPIGVGTADWVVAKYPDGVGYTPGDTWELFVGPDKVVKAFVYRRGGPTKPSVVIATWKDYKKAGPLSIATDHPGTADGNPFRMFFTGVAVKLAGSDTWVDAK